MAEVPGRSEVTPPVGSTDPWAAQVAWLMVGVTMLVRSSPEASSNTAW
jgi:hypothetical protein